MLSCASSFQFLVLNTTMTDAQDIDVLDLLQDVLATDRAFYGIVRFLDGGHRSNIVAAHMRNTNTALAILYRYMTTSQNIVINLPMNMDLSGNSFFDAVPVVPSATQIAAASEENVQAPADTTCPICQESVSTATRLRACGHCFHHDCISQWLSINVRCPVCRHDVRSVLGNSSLSTINEDGSMHTDS